MSDENFEWHGWGVSDRSVPSLHVGYLPLRRSACLYLSDTFTVRPLAYFRNEESAKEALSVLDRLMEVGNA